ncbi:MAG: glycosyltransferase, partial [bacterium]
MRVMMVVGHKGVWSGSSFQVVWTLQNLSSIGLEVCGVWSEGSRADRETLKPLEEVNIPLWTLKMNRFLSFSAIYQLRQLIKDFKPDVIEAVKSPAQYLTLAALMGNSHPALIFYRGISGKLGYFRSWKYRLPVVRRTIVNSEMLKRSLVENDHLSPERVDVVYGEYDPQCDETVTENPIEIRKILGLPQDRFILALVGNYAPWRGQKVALRAAYLLKKSRLPFLFLFCGKETERLQGEVRRLGLNDCVILYPFRRDVLKVLRAAHIAINASTANESLSGALINAQRLGIPAVATDVGGAKEIVVHNETGLIVPPGDAQALAEGIEKLFSLGDTSLEAMGMKAQMRALALFSSQEKMRRRLESYRRAMSQ